MLCSLSRFVQEVNEADMPIFVFFIKTGNKGSLASRFVVVVIFGFFAKGDL